MKEDSTRGKAMTNPRSYKRDVMTQTWLESRQLATIMRWLDVNGHFVRFKSDIVRECVEQIYYHIKDNKLVEVIDFADDARRLLENRFGDGSNNNSGRGKRNEIHNLVLDDRRREGAEYAPPVASAQQQQNSAPVKNSNNGYIMPSKQEIAAALKKVDEDRLRKEADEQIKRMKENAVRDEDGFLTTPSSGDCSSGIAYVEDIEKPSEEPAEDSCQPLTRTQEEIEEYRRKRDKEKEEELNRMI